MRLQFRWAYPQTTTTAEETIETLREWIAICQCSPKSVCATMAFSSPDFESCIRYYKIRPMLTGAATPWPNRAAAANKLCNQYLIGFVREIDKGPQLKNMPPNL